MKRIVVSLCVLLLTVSITALAQPSRSGYIYTQLQSFDGLPEGTQTVAELPGFFVPDIPGNFMLECEIADGTITYYNMNVWGGFPNLDPALTQNKSGWCFYVKNGLMDMTLAMSFNAADGKNYVIGDFVPYMLVDMEGVETDDFTVWVSDNNQGGVVLPSEFEGYVYIPFSSYVINDGTGTGAAYDASTGVVTPIYALSDGEMITFGAYYAYESQEIANTDEHTQPVITDEPTQPVVTDEPAQPVITDEPTQPVVTDEPTEAPSENLSTVPSEDPTEPKDEAGFPWIIVAVAAVVVIAGVVVAVVLISKKKKA